MTTTKSGINYFEPIYLTIAMAARSSVLGGIAAPGGGGSGTSRPTIGQIYPRPIR